MCILKLEQSEKKISCTSRKVGCGDVDREMTPDHLTNLRRTRPFYIYSLDIIRVLQSMYRATKRRNVYFVLITFNLMRMFLKLVRQTLTVRFLSFGFFAHKDF